MGPPRPNCGTERPCTHGSGWSAARRACCCAWSLALSGLCIGCAAVHCCTDLPKRRTACAHLTTTRTTQRDPPCVWGEQLFMDHFGSTRQSDVDMASVDAV